MGNEETERGRGGEWMMEKRKIRWQVKEGKSAGGGGGGGEKNDTYGGERSRAIAKSKCSDH